jgi:hypothetical protein
LEWLAATPLSVVASHTYQCKRPRAIPWEPTPSPKVR